MTFANHVDSALRTHGPSGMRIRTDLSATLFLADPEQYDGGELVIDDNFGMHSVKLQAGALAVYPSSSLHRVNAVTRGTRVASFFWIQSLVRDDAQRTVLFDLDMAVVRLTQRDAQAPELVSLTAVYHNLLRMWSEP
jgi:PKHD-type hydroxylase